MSEKDHLLSSDKRLDYRVHVHQLMVSHIHTQPVDSVCFSSDATMVASAAANDCVRLWSVAERRPVHILEGCAGKDTPFQVSFSVDSTLLAGPMRRGPIRLWTSDGRIAGELTGHDSDPTEAVFSPEGTVLVSGDLAGRIRLWDVTTKQMFYCFVGAPHGQVEGLTEQFRRMCHFAFTAHGTRLAFEGRDKQGLIQVWDIQYPGPIVVWVGSLLQSDQFLCDLTVSPDDHLLAIADFDQDVVHLFNARSLAQEGMLQIPDDMAIAIAFSPDGRFLATAGAAGTVWFWEMSTRQIVGSFAAHPEGPDYRKNAQEWALGDMDWSSDGRYLVTCGRDPYTVKLWEVHIGT
jgi:WD40 repeat protein